MKLAEKFVSDSASAGQEVVLKIFNGIVTIHNTQSMDYGGLLDREAAQVISKLSSSYPVTFTAFLAAKALDLKDKKSKSHRPLEIVIYGFRGDGDAVGDLLSENELYLQHPNSIDTFVTYINPQYLLKPGYELDLPMQVSDSLSRNIQMDQAVISQMLRVFDEAIGPATFSEVEASKRLKTNLKSYVT